MNRDRKPCFGPGLSADMVNGVRLPVGCVQVRDLGFRVKVCRVSFEGRDPRRAYVTARVGPGEPHLWLVLYIVVGDQAKDSTLASSQGVFIRRIFIMFQKNYVVRCSRHAELHTFMYPPK